MPAKVKKWYQGLMAWAITEKSLFILSFAESSIFPIPPDPFLINMTLRKPNRWQRYAAITAIASVLGGVVGYLIGAGLNASLGEWIISTYNLEDTYERLAQAFIDNAWITILAAAITPIPYKIFTIASGAFSLNFAVFLIASIIGRSIRFFAVALATSILGKRYKDKIENYIDLISTGILILVILVIVLMAII